MEQRVVSETVEVGPYVVRVEAAGCSDPGAVRTANEDSFVCAPTAFFVADGMGGHRFGDRASDAAVTVLEARLGAGELQHPGEVVGAVLDAHHAVSLIDSGLSAAGTTLAGIVLVTDPDDGTARWMVVNVGDSRVYEVSGGVLSQITVDHSAVQELVDAGEILAADAESHPERNVITRALGIDDGAEPDVWLLPLRDDQTFLVCSDGLTKELRDDQIADVVAAAPAGTAAEKLIAAALAQGGRDNVTVVVINATAARADGAADAELTGYDPSEDTLPSAR